MRIVVPARQIAAFVPIAVMACAMRMKIAAIARMTVESAPVVMVFVLLTRIARSARRIVANAPIVVMGCAMRMKIVAPARVTVALAASAEMAFVRKSAVRTRKPVRLTVKFAPAFALIIARRWLFA
ncbi:MAG: hypothetical protein JXB07_05000 [Anaerolineae bacterium]|nr:hypothetical protein [Anaerolineae bacterium]